MPDYSIRPAQHSDFSRIRALIHQVHINPTGLDWQRFVIATTPQDELVGCGQIKRHKDGSYELASIAVVPKWRGRGAARKIIDHLLASYPGTLYLTCRASLGPFYERFGFCAVSENEMTPYFRRLSRLAKIIGGMFTRNEGMLVMKRDP